MTPEREQRLNFVLNHRQPDLVVVLENVFDPHNISAVMRTCDAVGIQELFVLNTTIPPHQKWGKRSSSSAAKWLTIHQYQQLDDVIAALRQRNMKIYTTGLGKESRNLYHLDLTAPTALVFGNEKSGCSEEMMLASDGNFLIPQVGIIKSLNISVACAVSVYEAYRQKMTAGHYDSRKLDGDILNRLEQEWGLTENEPND